MLYNIYMVLAFFLCTRVLSVIKKDSQRAQLLNKPFLRFKAHPLTHKLCVISSFLSRIVLVIPYGKYKDSFLLPF